MKTKPSIITFLLIIVLGMVSTFVFGYFLGARANLYFAEGGRIFTERGIAISRPTEGKELFRIYRDVEIKGTTVWGGIEALSMAEISNIQKVMSDLEPPKPIDSIEVLNSSKVMVVREVGDDSHRKYYDRTALEKIHGEWVVIELSPEQ